MSETVERPVCLSESLSDYPPIYEGMPLSPAARTRALRIRGAISTGNATADDVLYLSIFTRVASVTVSNANGVTNNYYNGAPKDPPKDPETERSLAIIDAKKALALARADRETRTTEALLRRAESSEKSEVDRLRILAEVAKSTAKVESDEKIAMLAHSVSLLDAQYKFIKELVSFSQSQMRAGVETREAGYKEREEYIARLKAQAEAAGEKEKSFWAEFLDAALLEDARDIGKGIGGFIKEAGPEAGKAVGKFLASKLEQK